MIKKVTLLTTLGAITLGIAIGVSANGIVQKVQSEIRGDFVIKTNGQIQTLKSVDGETDISYAFMKEQRIFRLELLLN